MSRKGAFVAFVFGTVVAGYFGGIEVVDRIDYFAGGGAALFIHWAINLPKTRGAK